MNPTYNAIYIYSRFSQINNGDLNFMSDDNAAFRKEVISYFRRNVYNQGHEFLEWIPRNKAHILDLMKQKFKDYPVGDIEHILDVYYSKL